MIENYRATASLINLSPCLERLLISNFTKLQNEIPVKQQHPSYPKTLSTTRQPLIHLKNIYEALEGMGKKV